jgi:hypothetical protein
MTSPVTQPSCATGSGGTGKTQTPQEHAADLRCPSAATVKTQDPREHAADLRWLPTPQRWQDGVAAGLVRSMALKVGHLCDVRDSWGMWTEATILNTAPGKIYVHYENWGPQYDEWVSVHEEPMRIAPLHAFSGADLAASIRRWPAGTSVYAFRSHRERWLPGKVMGHLRGHVQVSFEPVAAPAPSPAVPAVLLTALLTSRVWLFAGAGGDELLDAAAADRLFVNPSTKHPA